MWAAQHIFLIVSRLMEFPFSCFLGTIAVVSSDVYLCTDLSASSDTELF